MTISTLAAILEPARTQGYAVAGLVCQGWEDIRAYAAAAEAERAPVVLQAGPACRKHTPLPVLAKMMRHVAQDVDVPVAIHLDHATSETECREALEEGFTSVMFDGSQLPLQENIERTAKIAELAHRNGSSCEGEIGFVGYAGGAKSDGTDPTEAATFAEQTQADAVAVSVGNVHLQTERAARLDIDRLAAIEAVTDVALVIHGGSGVPFDQRMELAKNSQVCKFNIGTELRMAFGAALRTAIDTDAQRFDRIEILNLTQAPIEAAARAAIRSVGASGRA
ncbi:MAG: class II fructose-bisphosphate aldolase [Pseudomonadota bacterium]